MSKYQSFADMLPWSHLTDSGSSASLVVTKHGQLLAGYYFTPPDNDSRTDEDADLLAQRVNEAMLNLGTGWATWCDVIATPSRAYPAPDESHFPNAFSRAVDAERRKGFEAEGQHFENDRVLCIAYTPPAQQVSRFANLFYTTTDGEAAPLQSQIITGFNATLQTIENQIGRQIGMRRMENFLIIDRFGNEALQDELVNYLNYATSGRTHGVILPHHGGYLDGLVASQDLQIADWPSLGRDYLGVVSIDGFPAESTANVTAALNTLTMPYRFSQRMIYLSPVDAVKLLGRYRKQWRQKQRGLLQVVFASTSGPLNEFAVKMTAETDDALSAAEQRDVLFGFYSATIVVRHQDQHRLQRMLDAVQETVQDCKFGARIEDLNTFEAWRGSLPGETVSNVRQPPMHTMTAAHLMPLTGVWAGEDRANCPLYPPGPALLHARTIGSIPFRLNLHPRYSDVGHTLVLGPTGAGKSTLTNTIAAQHLRYPHARIEAFDAKYGMMATALACGGRHYDLVTAGTNEGLYCPLADLEDDVDLLWATDYLGLLYEFSAHKPPPHGTRTSITEAVRRLAREDRHHRSLSEFTDALQDQEAREVFAHYTTGAAGSLLNGRHNPTISSDFNVYECEALLGKGTATSMPVLLHLFHQFERRLDGRPTLLFIAEAWAAFKHPMWQLRLEEWLRKLRSKNCAVVMDTQSLADAVKSDILPLLNESCQRKIFLPNAQAKQRTDQAGNPGSYELYRILGLNDNQIDIIQTAVPKEHYYVTGPDGARLISLGLSMFELSVLGATDEPAVKLIRKLHHEHGQNWLRSYLQIKGVDHALAA
jgi:type IV secretion system protein VirB4